MLHPDRSEPDRLCVLRFNVEEWRTTSEALLVSFLKKLDITAPQAAHEALTEHGLLNTMFDAARLKTVKDVIEVRQPHSDQPHSHSLN